MGKGTIVNHIADGQYNIILDIDDSRAQQSIINLDASILQLNTTIIELHASRGTAWAMYDSAKSKMNIIINHYISGTATKEQVAAAVADTNSKYRLYVEYDRTWWGAQLRQKSLQKRKEYIENKLAENPEPTVQAWCADLTEDLTGNVGTIEIPNERTNDVQVRPGYDGAAIYSASRDGQLQQVVSSTAPGVYYNYAMFPGWQKWKPTYRVGIITAKPTQDTANITLDAATSTVQQLDVNVTNTLTDVPIVYMDCDGLVFKVDDRVVVEFISQDHTNPRIIGFETNPKACNYSYYAIAQRQGTGTTNTIYICGYPGHELIKTINTWRDPYGLGWWHDTKEILINTTGNRIWFRDVDGNTTRSEIDLSGFSQYMRGVDVTPDGDVFTVGYDTVSLQAYLQVLNGFTNSEKSRSYLPSVGTSISYINGCTIWNGDLIICYLDGITQSGPGGAVLFQSRIRQCNGMNLTSIVTEWIEDINDFSARGLGIDPDGNLLSLHWDDTYQRANIRKHAGISSTQLWRHNFTLPINEYPTRWEGLTYIF
ncbi:MAG: hypothetical protein ACFFDY_01260 [Candidatus Thorarchaeota archaeon]